jgi:Fic family protein
MVMYNNDHVGLRRGASRMLFEAPMLDERETQVLEDIDTLKVALRYQLNEPRRWSGALRRMAFARNIQGSNSIEGFEATLDDAAAVAAGEEPMDVTTETRFALEGYRNAMTYVLQLAQESPISVSVDLVRSLHFMMTNYDLAARPGRWRAGSVFVQSDATGEIVHEGADLTRLPELMSDLVASMNDPEGIAIVSAAMAHLNLVMIHPFRDGNGRMARCLQSLMLAADGTLAPVFMSIEEYLGRNTQAYYDVLAEVGGGSWQPERDARPWIRFILTAHLRQAQTLQHRVKASERIWISLEALVNARRLPERSMPALFDAASGYRLRRATYAAALSANDDEVSDQTATRDLKALVDAGLLTPEGDKRGRVYTAAGPLKEIREQARASRQPRSPTDPFAAPKVQGDSA